MRSLELAIKYLAGDRLIGTAAERAALTTPTTAAPHWQILDRVTSSTSTTITTDEFSPKEHLMVIWDGYSGSGEETGIRFGNPTIDSGGNYARRWSDSASANLYNQNGANSGRLGVQGGSGTPVRGGFSIGTWQNIAGREKIGIQNSCSTRWIGADQYVNPYENTLRYSGNESDPITKVQIEHESSNMDAAAELIVLGYNATDTTGDPAWASLREVDLSGGANANISTGGSGSWTTKKFLWIQAVLHPSGGAIFPKMFFNNDDSGSNYSYRNSYEGEAYTNSGDPEVSQDSFAKILTATDPVGANFPVWINVFIRNKTGQEKAMIMETLATGSTGVTSANAQQPMRTQMFGKWSPSSLSGQITEIDFTTTQNSFGTASELKVWGFD